jgi:cytochrome c oxidase subunit 3
VLTGLHALHLTVGVGAVLAAARALARPERRATQVRVTALYWHFVDVVWIFLLPLLYLVS